MRLLKEMKESKNQIYFESNVFIFVCLLLLSFSCLLKKMYSQSTQNEKKKFYQNRMIWNFHKTYSKK